MFYVYFSAALAVSLSAICAISALSKKMKSTDPVMTGHAQTFFKAGAKGWAKDL